MNIEFDGNGWDLQWHFLAYHPTHIMGNASHANHELSTEVCSFLPAYNMEISSRIVKHTYVAENVLLAKKHARYFHGGPIETIFKNTIIVNKTDDAS